MFQMKHAVTPLKKDLTNGIMAQSIHLNRSEICGFDHSRPRALGGSLTTEHKAIEAERCSQSWEPS